MEDNFHPDANAARWTGFELGPDPREPEMPDVILATYSDGTKVVMDIALALNHAIYLGQRQARREALNRPPGTVMLPSAPPVKMSYKEVMAARGGFTAPTAPADPAPAKFTDFSPPPPPEKLPDATPQVIKQVIVIRKSLSMRRGKEIAQGAHAALAWLTQRIAGALDGTVGGISQIEKAWLLGDQRTICVQADDDQFNAVIAMARAVNLEVNVITDDGNTEFHGKKTVTCAAIGPAPASAIDAITFGLKLY